MRIRMTHARFDAHIEELPKRAWLDGCGHKQSEYIGSVLVRNTKSYDPVDVYVHEGDIGVNQAHVCVRYGASGCEYMSAGTVLDFLATNAARPDFYPEVADLEQGGYWWTYGKEWYNWKPDAMLVWGRVLEVLRTCGQD